MQLPARNVPIRTDDINDGTSDVVVMMTIAITVAISIQVWL
jgi:hypothetical protein